MRDFIATGTWPASATQILVKEQRPHPHDGEHDHEFGYLAHWYRFENHAAVELMKVLAYRNGVVDVVRGSARTSAVPIHDGARLEGVNRMAIDAS